MDAQAPTISTLEIDVHHVELFLGLYIMHLCSWYVYKYTSVVHN